MHEGHRRGTVGPQTLPGFRRNPCPLLWLGGSGPGGGGLGRVVASHRLWGAQHYRLWLKRWGFSELKASSPFSGEPPARSLCCRPLEEIITWVLGTCLDGALGLSVHQPGRSDVPEA